MRTIFTVDLNDTNTYTDEDVQALETLVPKQVFPEFYDNDNFETIQFDGFGIVEENQITTDLGGSVTSYDVFGRSQQARMAGGTSDEDDDELDKDICSGVQLHLPPPMYYTVDNSKFSIITGHRRDKIHRKRNFTNRIVAKYSRKVGFTDNQVQSELSKLGNIWNPKQKSNVPAKQYDIEEDGFRAVTRGWCEWDLTEIQNRLRPQAKAAGIGDTVLSLMSVNVYNRTNPKQTGSGKFGSAIVLPMGDDRAAEWMEASPYKNIKGKIEYRPLSYSTWGKNFSTLQIYASKNPDVEIRVVVHAGIFNSPDRKLQYDNRVSRFYKKMYEVLTAVGINSKVTKPLNFGNIVLYGAIPQLAEHHDLTKLNLFKQNGDGEYYQKK